MAGGSYREAMRRVCKEIATGVAVADENASLARRMGDTDYEVRQLRANVLAAELHKAKERLGR